MSKPLYIIVAMLFCGQLASAQQVYNSSGGNKYNRKKQEAKKQFDPQKIIFGGGVSLGFGNITTLGISPVVGYRLTEKFSAGLGAGYLYYKRKNAYGPNMDLRADFTSGSVWARYLVFNNIFVHAEYEHNFTSYSEPRYDSIQNIVNVRVKYNAPSLLLGAGLRQPISNRASIVFTAVYDVLQNERSPYYQTIGFRTGFLVGF